MTADNPAPAPVETVSMTEHRFTRRDEAERFLEQADFFPVSRLGFIWSNGDDGTASLSGFGEYFLVTIYRSAEHDH